MDFAVALCDNCALVWHELFMRLYKSWLFIFFIFFVQQATADVVAHFNRIKSDPNALYAFLKNMPKGGELHYHLAGGAYPETMVALAAQGNYCLNKNTLALNKTVELCHGVKSSDIYSQPELYHQIIRAWSLKDFVAGQESSHDHFFASFFKFMQIVADFRPQLLAEIIKRAASQQALYLEVMILPDNAHSASFANLIQNATSFAEKKRLLLTHPEFKKNIQHTITESARILKKTRQILGCDKNPHLPACKVTVKFQYYILREQAPDNMFAQAVNAFAAASASPDLVGVNLVQAEDGIISLRDYRMHMQVMQFLHQIYPNVHISLHAGEMAPTAVPPEDLRFHIHDAIFTGHAERIGHGVDIAYENQAERIVQYMAERPIPVEINLISNQKILQISGKNHPLLYYLAHHVPVVLSTDDEGILRTDLTQQYVEAVMTHGIGYHKLKTINRNALTYSFLPGKSIWKDAKHSLPIAACENLENPTCLEFIKTNEKARIQWQLEKQLSAFEKSFAASHEFT